MKTKSAIKVLTLFILLIWEGCQTTPKILNPEFNEFKIQKIVSTGIETLVVKPTSDAWPRVQTVSTSPLPSSTKNLRLAVIGDTGCRLKENQYGKTYQDCSSAKEWPYADVVKALGAENYNFGIHTGDYHYREQCTDAKLCPAFGKYFGYGWGAWWDDFYGPSQSLFLKTPWLFVRGNHEDCNRAYLGWAALSATTKPFTDGCTGAEPYQWIEMDDLVLINFDNSAMEDRKPLKKEDIGLWNSKFVEIKNRIQELKTKKEVWFLTHKPMFGFVPNSTDAEPQALSPFMADMLKQSGLYDKIDIFLSGHIHTQQVDQLPEKLQLVVAHSGTSLDSFGRKILTDKINTTTESKYSFGYAIFEKLGFKKWNFIFKDQKGVTQLSCLSTNNTVNCE